LDAPVQQYQTPQPDSCTLAERTPFNEDQSRARDRNLAANLSWLRRFAITKLKQHPSKHSIKGKMQIDKAFLIAQPMRKASWTKCGDAGGESVEG